MMTQPRSKALFGGGPWPANYAGGRVDLFNTAEGCLAFMFGPPQHDAHLRRRVSHQHTLAYHAAADAGDARVRALLASKRNRQQSEQAS